MKKNNKKGFTLVELVIVVAVMAILVAVAIPTISSITGEAKTNVQNSNAQTIESMIKLAEAESTLSAGVIEKALYDAKLGIDGGEDGVTFVYLAASGECVVKTDDVTVATGDYEILIKDGEETAIDGSGIKVTKKS